MSRRSIAVPGVFLALAVVSCTTFADPAPLERDEVAAKSMVMPEPLASIPSESSPALSVMGSAARRAPVDQSGPLPSAAQTTMIIRTGQASIRVDSLDRAIARVGQLAASVGGYLANTSIQSGEQQPRRASLEIKVPADRYQGAVDRLAEIGKVSSVTTSAQDVGEEFVDVTARVANAKRLEERLVTLLATRTGKLDDVLSVERELARVREEIERYEGRLRWLKTQASMSTLTLALYEPGPLVGTPGQNIIVEALKESWRNFVAVIAGGIAAAGTAVPVLLLIGLAGLLARAGWRRLRRPNAVAA